MRDILTGTGIILILLLVTGISVSAISSKISESSGEKYQVLEKEYCREVSGILLEKGYKNAGITLTYLLNQDGRREYIVTVYHRKLKEVEENEWRATQERIRQQGEKIFQKDQVKMVKILSDI